MLRRSLVCFTLSALMIQGCSGNSLEKKEWLPTHVTAGQVTINGAPAEGAIVRLYPVTPQADVKFPVIPTGTVQADGTFELTSYMDGDGAPEGDYRVTLEWPDPKLNASKGGMPEDPPDRLRNQFINPDRTQLKAHVSAGKNQLEPIVLEKVKILTGSTSK